MIRPLSVFLCHAKDDKRSVRSLNKWLAYNAFDPWLDEERLLPGQEWEREIRCTVRKTDVVLVCLSRKSISKKGFVQKEIVIALDIADEQPEGAVFIIPVKLEECDVPERLRRWQWVNLFDAEGYRRLRQSLEARARELTVNSNSEQFNVADQILRAEWPNSTQQPRLVNIAKRPRVRGVLAAVRQIVEELPDQFDKHDILMKLYEKDPKLAEKIAPETLRNTLRQLRQRGVIELQTEATSVTCAKYLKRRLG